MAIAQSRVGKRKVLQTAIRVPGPFWQQQDSLPGKNSHIWPVKRGSLWSLGSAVCNRLIRKSDLYLLCSPRDPMSKQSGYTCCMCTVRISNPLPTDHTDTECRASADDLISILVWAASPVGTHQSALQKGDGPMLPNNPNHDIDTRPMAFRSASRGTGKEQYPSQLGDAVIFLFSYRRRNIDAWW